MSKSQKLIAICPECKHEKIYNGTALRPRITCSECKTRYYLKTQKAQIESSSQIKKSIPPQNTAQEHSRFIDDPDELLMSVAIRELNKPNPDSRWATILIACRKENIAIKSEVIDQLQKLPTKALTEMLRKQSGKSSLAE